MTRRISTYIPLVFLMVALYFAFCWRLFADGRAINISPDNEWFLGAVFSYSSAAIRSFELPLRMDTILGGIPLYNSPQFSVWYPFYFLFLDVWGTPLASIRSLHLITLLHIGIFFANSYLLSRSLNISRLSAILGATFIVFNMTTLEIMKWANLIASYSWLPLYFAGVITLLGEPWSVSGILMTVIGFVMIAFAMVGQPLILAGILTSAVVVGRSFSFNNFTLSELYHNMAPLVITIGVALLISAVVVLPVVWDFSAMIRWVSSTCAVVGNDQIPFKYFITDQISPIEVSSFILPGGHRHDIANPYIGLLPLIFSLTAIRFRKRHWIIVPLAVVSLYAFFSAFGDNWGLARLNYCVPVVNKIREPSYFLLPFNVTVGMLAAFGFDSLLQRAKSLSCQMTCRFSLHFVVFSVGLVILVCTLIFLFNPKSPWMLVIVSCCVYIACTYWVPAFKRQFSVASIGILFIVSIIVQMSAVVWKAPSVSDSDYLRLNMVELEAAISRIVKLDPGRQFRVIFGGGVNYQYAAMLASYQGVRTLNSYVSPLPFKQFNEMYYQGPRLDSYNKGLGAKYLICRDCTESEIRGYHFLDKVSGYLIYTANDALPSTYITGNLVGKAMEQVVGPGDRRAACVLKYLRKSINKIEVVVCCDEPAFFVVNEFFSGAWRLSMNGINIRPIKVNGNQIGIRLNPGSSVIELTYDPWSLYFSQFLSVAGFLGLGAIFLVRRKVIGLKSQSLRTEASQ